MVAGDIKSQKVEAYNWLVFFLYKNNLFQLFFSDAFQSRRQRFATYSYSLRFFWHAEILENFSSPKINFQWK